MSHGVICLGCSPAIELDNLIAREHHADSGKNKGPASQMGLALPLNALLIDRFY